MNSEFKPEQKTPKVTFGNYVVPETVQEHLPPEPAAPVAFDPVPASKPAPMQKRLAKAPRTQSQPAFGAAALKFDPDFIGKCVLVLLVFCIAVLFGYLTGG